MSNIKSWADASSDEESDDGRIAPPPSGLPGSTSYHDIANQSDEEDSNAPPPPQYTIPTQPPYTAFIGNLNYDMANTNDLGRELEILLQKRRLEVVDEQSGQVRGVVRISSARLMINRDTGESRGYGYCEFDSPGELLAFLQMDNPQLCGRSIKVDVASSTPQASGGGDGRRQSERGSRGGRDRGDRDSRGGGRNDNRGSDRNLRGSRGQNDMRGGAPPPKIDGAQFRGGLHKSSGSMRRGDSSLSSHGSGTHLGGSVPGGPGGNSSGGAPRQRPSLKLSARTKPLEDAGPSKSQSSIFGGAKPRDESKHVVEKKQAEQEELASSTTKEEEDVATKDVTSGMEKMEILNKPGVGVDALNDVALEPFAADTSSSSDKKSNNEGVVTAADATKPPDETAKKPTVERKDSRGGGRGRGGRGKDNSDRKREGRRDSTNKSGRGRGRGGGRRENSDSGRGRGDKRNNSKSNVKKSENGTNGSSSSLAAAAAAAAGSEVANKMPTMPVAQSKKKPPKKINSFAALGFDSDSD